MRPTKHIELLCIAIVSIAFISVNSNEAQQITTGSQSNNNKLLKNNVEQLQANANVKEEESQLRRQYNQQLAEDEYFVGVGIADITGPAADINLMGYAKPNQDAGGIHLRQFSRSIMIEDSSGTRFLYINLDNGMISQLLRTNVINRLKQNYGSTTFNESNVMLTGGFFQYMLYNIPSAGFISQTLLALEDGIVRSVERALNSIKPARIYYNKGELLDASINRSPTSYANNPEEERVKYKHNTDKEMFLLRFIDRQSQPIAMLNWFAVHGTSMNNSNHLISSDNKGYAALLFEQDFNPPNTMPGKGKFVAIFAQANEGDVSPNTMGPRCIDTGLPCDPVTSTCGTPPRNEKCIAFGPGKDMFESTQIIAYKQYFKAKQLFTDVGGQQQVRGPVRYVHQHIDITEQVVPLYESAVKLEKSRFERRRKTLAQVQQDEKVGEQTSGQRLKRLQVVKRRQLAATSAAAAEQQQHQPIGLVEGNNNSNKSSTSFQTCRAALGYSFAAGTTDGPGAFDFQQGDTVSTKYWNLVRDFLKKPSEPLIKCHSPKPILLATGQMDFPYMWHPRVVPTQLFMLGQIAIVGLPGEFTTMAGRRVREAVRKTLSQSTSSALNSNKLIDPLVVDETREGETDDKREVNQEQQQQQVEVVLSGLSNIYTSYITTIEEYEMQRYEGASTLYGPHTLQAYVNQFTKLAHKLLNAQQIDDSVQPPDLSKSLFTLKAGVIFDACPHGKTFGSLLQDVDVQRVYRPGELVTAVFVSGNPRNDLRQENTFLSIEYYNETSGLWQVIATDSSWETKFIWERTNTLFGESRAIVHWTIPANCRTGIYRVKHFGAHKSLLQQTIGQYVGKSSPFKVMATSEQHEGEQVANAAAAANNNNNNNDDDDQLVRLETMRQIVEHLESQQSDSSSSSNSGANSISIQRESNGDQSNYKHSRSSKSILASILTPLSHYLSSMFQSRTI